MLKRFSAITAIALAMVGCMSTPEPQRSATPMPSPELIEKLKSPIDIKAEIALPGRKPQVVYQTVRASERAYFVKDNPFPYRLIVIPYVLPDDRILLDVSAHWGREHLEPAPSSAYSSFMHKQIAKIDQSAEPFELDLDGTKVKITITPSQAAR